MPRRQLLRPLTAATQWLRHLAHDLVGGAGVSGGMRRHDRRGVVWPKGLRVVGHGGLPRRGDGGVIQGLYRFVLRILPIPKSALDRTGQQYEGFWPADRDNR